jgi:flagellum-specific ATP synthase
MSEVVTDEHKELANNIKTVLATYMDVEDLINIGAYSKGSNEDIDYAISKIKLVNNYLTQKTNEKFELEEEFIMMKEIFM